MKKTTLRPDVSVPRRGFLRRSLWLLAPFTLPVFSLPVAARDRRGRSESTTPTIDVRDKGARGDGVHDDTDAIQAAIDALPASGGTVTITDGNYLVDAARAIHLGSNTRLVMTPDATLRAMANDLERSHVIKVWRANNVQIIGGRIVGERAGHRGTTGEWGYGINIQASNNVHVIGTHVSNCWGDGFWIGALGRPGSATASTGVTLDHVISTNNRRQGLSIGPVRGVRVIHSTFSNSHGSKSQCGIDIEPQSQGMAQDITISDCTMHGNRGNGLELHAHVRGVVVKRCKMQDNHGYGVLSVAARELTLAQNIIVDNGLAGVRMAGDTSAVQITDNTVADNSARYVRRVALWLGSARGRERANLQITETVQDATVSGNKFQR